MTLDPRSFAERFREQVRLGPDRVAISASDGRVTYEQLEALARRIAPCVAAPGSDVWTAAHPIGLVLDHGSALVAAITGCLVAGRCYVPLDPQLPAGRLEALVRLTRPALLLANRARRDLAGEIAGPATKILAFEDVVTADPGPYTAESHGPRRPGVILTTSGSTGEPKAVAHSELAMLHAADRYCEVVELGRTDRVGLVTRCMFAPSIHLMLAPLLAGASLHPYDLVSKGFSALGPWLQADVISLIYTVPTLFRRLVAQIAENAELSGLRLWNLGGEPVLASDVRKFRERFPPSVKLLQTMGATECTLIAWNLLEDRTRTLEGVLPIGRAFPDVEVRIEDDAGREAAVGEIGELIVTGPRVAAGYHGDRALSESRFSRRRPDAPWSFRTGDIGKRLADGTLIHQGRKDDQIKIGGVRVQPAEVQAVVNDLPGVREAYVAPRRLRDGTGLVAYVAADPAADFDVRTLRAQAKSRLPLAMQPAMFLVLPTLPMTPAGKVDADALPEVPNAGDGSTEDRNSPADQDDLILGGICAAFERVLERRVALHDDFFALGGDSLGAVELAMLVRQNFNLEIDVSALLDRPTPALLASRVAESVRSGLPTGVVRLSRSFAAEDDMTLFFVPGLGGHVLCYRHLIKALGPGYAGYGLEFPGVNGDMEPAASIEELADRLVSNVLTTAPEGRLVIVAYSMGGVVAFEMNRRLREIGREADFLAFNDCYAPWAMRPLSLRHKTEGWLRYLANSAEPDRWRTVAARFKTSLLHGRGQGPRPAEIGLAHPGFEDPEGLLANVQNEHIRRVALASRGAVRAYRPQVSACRILLFPADRRGRPPRGQLDLYAEWQRLSRGGVETLLIPGTHRDVLLPQAAALVARRLRERLGAASDVT
jgi:amino acid adenylation domain-containing protein